MEPSKPTDRDQGAEIPAQSPARMPPVDQAPLVGEIIPKGVPIGRMPPEPPRLEPRPIKKSRPLRTVLIVLLAIVGATCIGGLGVGYFLYDKATEPERGTPATSLEQYLNAKFVTRDGPATVRFICESPELGEIDSLEADLRAREEEFGIVITVTSSDLLVTMQQNNASIELNLKINVPEGNGQSSRSVQRWRFELLRADGWRVCGAERLS